MSPRSRHRKRISRRSKALFSGNLWRSISRGRPRSALGSLSSELDLSTAPTFPCNPSHKTATRSATTTEQYPSLSSHTSASTSLRNLYWVNSSRAYPSGQDSNTQNRRLRPSSWFSFAQHNRTKANSTGPLIPTPHPSSMSSISQRRIGTPVLTSTTNLRVADSENVEYSDVLFPDYSSRDAPVLDEQVDDPSDSDHLQYPIVHPSTWSSTVRSMKQKLTHRRRASTSVLLETPWARRVAELKGRMTSPGTGSEGIIHHMHAHKGKVRQRSAPNDSIFSRSKFEQESSTYGDLTSLIFASQNRSTPNLRSPPRLPGLYLEMDKLDFSSSPTLVSNSTALSKLKKAKSYLSLHRFVRDCSDRTLDRDEVVVSLSPEIIASRETENQRSKDRVNDEKSKQDMYQPKIRASKPIQLRFSGQKKRYVPSDPDTNSPGGVNPLRMHPEVGNSTSGSGLTTLTTRRSPEDFSERQSGSIDTAVIYSPSTGSLSMYSRTPSTNARPTVPKERVPQETPTRKPLRNASSSMLRKSMNTFLGKSASMLKMASFSPTKNLQPERDASVVNRHRTKSDTQAVSSKRLADVQVRSMSTPDMHNSDAARAPWDYQPSTPSPLRKSTMIVTTSKCLQQAVTTATPIRTPASAIMLDRVHSSGISLGPGKGYGRYGDHDNTASGNVF